MANDGNAVTFRQFSACTAYQVFDNYLSTILFVQKQNKLLCWDVPVHVHRQHQREGTTTAHRLQRTW
jgi:hypothetical protein